MVRRAMRHDLVRDLRMRLRYHGVTCEYVYAAMARRVDASTLLACDVRMRSRFWRAMSECVHARSAQRRDSKIAAEGSIPKAYNLVEAEIQHP